MLLSDRDLHALLPELRFETDEHGRPFSPENQIQPASIDLRLDRCFWIGRKPSFREAIDFRHAGVGEIEIQRRFRSRWLRQHEVLTLRPGEMVLGRTFEKFSIPNGYAENWKDAVRTHDSVCPFTAPEILSTLGGAGRMPLQLVNHGKVPIILPPYVQLCQLLVVRTTTPSDRPYGTETADHKYADDDGGPSKFWQDKSLVQLQQSLGQHGIPAAVQTEFLEAFGRVNYERMDRFSHFVSTLRSREITSSREVMQHFAARDSRRHTWALGGLRFLRWAGLALVGGSLWATVKTPYNWLHACLWIITIVLFPLGVWASFFAPDPPQPFREADVEEYFRERR